MTFDFDEFIKTNEALCEAATEGPWKAFDNGSWGGKGAAVAIGDDINYWPLFDQFTTPKGIANSFFCAKSRTSLPLALKLLRKYREALEKLNTGPGNNMAGWKATWACEFSQKALAYDPTKEGGDK